MSLERENLGAKEVISVQYNYLAEQAKMTHEIVFQKGAVVESHGNRSVVYDKARLVLGETGLLWALTIGEGVLHSKDLGDQEFRDISAFPLKRGHIKPDEVQNIVSKKINRRTPRNHSLIVADERGVRVGTHSLYTEELYNLIGRDMHNYRHRFPCEDCNSYPASMKRILHPYPVLYGQRVIPFITEAIAKVLSHEPSQKLSLPSYL